MTQQKINERTQLPERPCGSEGLAPAAPNVIPVIPII